MVDEEHERPGGAAGGGGGQVPFGTELFTERNGAPRAGAQAGRADRRPHQRRAAGLRPARPASRPCTSTWTAPGARIFQQVTRENVGKRMAIVLVEKGKAEVVTAPVIREEIGGGRVQISGRMTTREANDVALLLRAGALAAPMEIIEERTVGPILGAENIEQGLQLDAGTASSRSRVFMIVYYALFGVISVIALAVNLMLLVALLSMLQATLTLPGIAAIALTLGMAIDANVLINERIREELRNGTTPQAAIHAGYERAWGTILDSNVTTLIAGIALFAVRLGPGARLRRRALPRHPDLDVHRGVGLARHREPDLRQPQASSKASRSARCGSRRKRQPAAPANAADAAARTTAKEQHMEFFRIKRDIPFMRHALVFNVISLVTFLLAVVFLATKGLHFGVDFTGGTVMEVQLRAAGRLRPASASAIDKLGFTDAAVQNFGTLARRADPPAGEGGRVQRASCPSG